MEMSLDKLWELVMDRAACHGAVHAVTKSRAQLIDWTELKLSDGNTDHLVQILSPDQGGD